MASKHQRGSLRIIAGRWKRQTIHFVGHGDLRPTPNAIRETLFNWLAPVIEDASCLDLFSGSGALGFEAASRGAKSVVMVENNAMACRLIKENTVKLSADQIKIKQADVFNFLAGDATPFDIIFLDPPFSKGLAPQACHWLEDKGWLAAQAKIYVEVESQLILDDMPENWTCLKNKLAGEVAYYLFERSD